MHSDAKNVTEYLKEVPEARQPALAELRALIREVLPDCDEVMEYGMPSYKRKNGEGMVAFASQKQYISLYVLIDVLDANRDALQGISVGKCCIRYTTPQKMDFAVIRKMLEESAASTEGAY